jgi:hypothetical protein
MIKQTTTSFTPRNGESDEGQQNSASKQVETFTIDAPQCIQQNMDLSAYYSSTNKNTAYIHARCSKFI